MATQAELAQALPTAGLQRQAWLAAIVSTLCFSIAPPIGRLVLSFGVGPLALLTFRAALTLALFLVSASVISPRQLRLDRRSLLVSLACGAISGLGMLAFFWSLTRIATALASMMFSLYPLGVLGLLWLRGEKLTRRNLVRLAMGLAGVYLLIGPDGRADWLGVGLVLLAVGGASLQMALVHWFLRDRDVQSVNLYMIVGMLAVVGSGWLWQGADTTGLDWRAWLGIGVLAVVCTFVSRWLMMASIRYLGSGQYALLVPLETTLTVTWSILFLGEGLTIAQALGGALTILSAALAVDRLVRVPWRPRRRARPEA